MKLEFEKETYAIRGACFEVYRDKGCGFLEDVYQECLEIEFEEREISFVAQPELDLFYKGKKLRKNYKPDFICYGEVLVEIKATQNLDSSHVAQVINYLKATGKKVALLVNFGHHPQIECQRIIL